MTRVFALYKQMSSHTTAGFRELVAQGATLRVLHRTATSEAPYSDDELLSGLDARGWTDTIDDATVRDELEAFAPELILVCSWDVGAYRRAMHRWRCRAVRIVVMDNQWRGTLKQWAGRLARRVIIARSYDAAFVTGERQANFATRLGFAADSILWGAYTCDPAFYTGPQANPRHAFVYVGRLAPEKGIDVLATAYTHYRGTTTDPWPLRIIGSGPLAAAVGGIDGVELHGFVPPAELPALLSDAGCLVLPSRFEPWGVVVQEAAAAGLAVICTNACGASTRLVLDGLNGRVIGVDDPAQLTNAMQWVTAASETERFAMSEHSTALAAQLTPERWAGYLLDRGAELRPRVVRG